MTYPLSIEARIIQVRMIILLQENFSMQSKKIQEVPGPRPYD
jgi:hypothetical protein